MTVIKGLAEGREVTHHGHAAAHPVGAQRHAGDLDGRLRARRRCELAGEQADGFILQTADPDIARWTIGAVRAAAR